jgi:hypothetical protein
MSRLGPSARPNARTRRISVDENTSAPSAGRLSASTSASRRGRSDRAMFVLGSSRVFVLPSSSGANADRCDLAHRGRGPHTRRVCRRIRLAIARGARPTEELVHVERNAGPASFARDRCFIASTTPGFSPTTTPGTTPVRRSSSIRSGVGGDSHPNPTRSRHRSLHLSLRDEKLDLDFPEQLADLPTRSGLGVTAAEGLAGQVAGASDLGRGFVAQPCTDRRFGTVRGPASPATKASRGQFVCSWMNRSTSSSAGGWRHSNECVSPS